MSGSQSRSRSRSPGDYRRATSASRSGSRSPAERPAPRDSPRSRSRSRSEPPRRERSRSHDRAPKKSRDSRSPMSDRRRHHGNREEPEPNKCLGVFGLSLYTTERELEKEFSKFGSLEKCQVVLDGHSGRSRGFAFVYYENIEDSTEARNEMNGIELDGRKIRVDYSITKRPHTPTPGMYMGRPTGKEDRDRGYRGGRGGGRGRGGGGYRDDRGYGGGRDRYDDRRDDRYGGDRYGGDRYGGDRYGGDRYGGDRYGDRRGGDRYGGGGDRYGEDRYGGGSRRPRSPSPYYREQRPRRDYRSRSRSYERPRY